MSSLFQNLESILTQAATSASSSGRQGRSVMGDLAGMLGMGGQSQERGQTQQNAQGGAPMGALSGLLGPAALGGLAGVLLGGKGVRSMAGGALLAGGGAYLWDKYKDQITSAYKDITSPGGGAANSAPSADGGLYDLDDSFEPVPASPQPQLTRPAESPLAASAHAAAQASSGEDAALGASKAGAAEAALPASAHAAAAQAAAATSAHAAAQTSRGVPAASAHEAAAQGAPADLARRIVTALVFAAKADGHIDDAEQKAIADKMRDLNLGPETQSLVQQAMNAPLDPSVIADGITDPELAMQLFMLSCSVIDVDHFMERSYLDALASALRIPKEMKDEMEAKIRSLKQEA